MPPPMVTCHVCKQHVMKAQTYHVGGGNRACKEHEGVLDKKTELEHQETEKKIAATKAAAERTRYKEAMTDAHALCNRCWACRREAMTAQEMKMKILVAMERLNIKNIMINPLNDDYHKELQRELGILDKKQLVTCLYPVDDALRKRLPMMAAMSSSFIGAVNLCQDCASNFGLSKKLLEPPTLSPEQFGTFGVLYDLLVRPTVHSQAERELIEEAGRN